MRIVVHGTTTRRGSQQPLQGLGGSTKLAGNSSRRYASPAPQVSAPLLGYELRLNSKANTGEARGKGQYANGLWLVRQGKVNCAHGKEDSKNSGQLLLSARVHSVLKLHAAFSQRDNRSRPKTTRKSSNATNQKTRTRRARTSAGWHPNFPT